MQSIFAAAWRHLTLEDIEAFLSEAGDEGLLWEAKADHPNSSLSPKKISEGVCGLANSVGGYLLLGVSRSDPSSSWMTPGLRIPDPEPIAWVSRLLADRLRPIPRFDAQAWSVGEGRHVIVVEVWPVAVPPCLTRDGLAYERVTSQTLKVDNPTRLSELLRAGESAVAQSRGAAREAAAVITKAMVLEPLDVPVTRVALGLAAAGYAPDISSRLFSRTFMNEANRLLLEVRPELTGMPNYGGHPSRWAHWHDRVWLLADVPGPSMPENQRLAVRARWDGSATLLWESTNLQVTARFAANEICRLGFEVVRGLVHLLGGYGEGHLTIRAQCAGPASPGNVVSLEFPIERQISTVSAPGGIDLESVEREFLRASGMFAWEPEPDDA